MPYFIVQVQHLNFGATPSDYGTAVMSPMILKLSGVLRSKRVSQVKPHPR